MIEVSDLSRSYANSRAPVISGLSFSVRRGEILWVAGPSGSGKTTLLNVLGLLSTANSGEYRIDGQEMLGAPQQVRARSRRDVVSTVFQRGNLFAHLSAVDNVLVGMHPKERSVAEASLAAVGMAGRERQPAGLMSGGEQGRVAIARATARRTPVLLADEPVSGLDDANASAVLQLLEQAGASGVAVVVVSHDPRVGPIASATLTLPARQAA
ncbi:ABC transporter ATP-binding protein [Cellulomonas fimi]|uniref:ATP-binding cassette domain-containing protein n=1 Tax=Cellulomonas fimi TaxID=1708 RepID=A0A7Y0LYU7_CELFI|nr:ATP-binding cassette domain-containing protein [Cellulomonas fimi]NMR20742.1 ATP-binding cassette domain-containing protein [Cellulomonas fimi]